jgi:hypothetical protein
MLENRFPACHQTLVCGTQGLRTLGRPIVSTHGTLSILMKEVLIVRDFGHQGFVTPVGFTHGRAIVPRLRIGQSESSSACVSSSSDGVEMTRFLRKAWHQEEGPRCCRVCGNARCHSGNRDWHDPTDWLSRRQCVRERR